MDERAKQIRESHRNCVSVSPHFAGGADFMSSWNAICDRAESRIEVLIGQLRDMGVKAVHPNDGWVKRGNDGIPYSVSFTYPDFIDKIEIGDKIALKGFFNRELQSDFVKLYEVTGIIPWGCSYINYEIKPTNEIYMYHESGELELFKKSFISFTPDNIKLIIAGGITAVIISLFMSMVLR